MKRNPRIIDHEKFEYMKNNIEKIGYFYSPQKDANFRYSVKHGMGALAGEYGLAFTSEQWVRDLIESKTEWTLAHYAAPGWGRNHDAVTIVWK